MAPRSPFAKLVDRPVARLSEGELLARARSADYWRELAPALAVGEARGDRRALPADLDVAALGDELAADGYFAAPPLLDEGALREAEAAVRAVRQEGWPPVFAWVYDTLWDSVGTGAVDELSAGLLGEGYRQSSGLWLNYVRPVEGAMGWGPHVDIPTPSSWKGPGPERLTVWIAVTDATLESSCIHVLPRRWAQASDVDLARGDSISVEDALTLLHGARALPAKAGAVLGWAPNILHWGSPRVGAGTTPRTSLSLEFLHEGARARPRERVMDRGERPDFASRLSLIGEGLGLYAADENREPWAHRFLPLGRLLAP